MLYLAGCLIRCLVARRQPWVEAIAPANLLAGHVHYNAAFGTAVAAVCMFTYLPHFPSVLTQASGICPNCPMAVVSFITLLPPVSSSIYHAPVLFAYDVCMHALTSGLQQCWFICIL
jgi:hypothetical protein